MARTIERPETEPLVLVGHGAAAEPLEDLVAVAGRHTRTAVAHPQPRLGAVVRRPQGDHVAGTRCASPRCRPAGAAPGSAAARRRLQSPTRSRPASNGGRRGRGPWRGRRWSGRRDRPASGDEVGPIALGEQDQVADEAGHPVDLVEQQLAGLGDLLRVSESSSSRWPRRTVNGVRSSCPASSRNCRCPTNAYSSRSSIRLTVWVSAEMSSLPITGIRRDRSVVGDLAAVPAVAQRREQPAGLPCSEPSRAGAPAPPPSRRSASCRARRRPFSWNVTTTTSAPLSTSCGRAARRPSPSRLAVVRRAAVCVDERGNRGHVLVALGDDVPGRGWTARSVVPPADQHSSSAGTLRRMSVVSTLRRRRTARPSSGRSRRLRGRRTPRSPAGSPPGWRRRPGPSRPGSRSRRPRPGQARRGARRWP